MSRGEAFVTTAGFCAGVLYKSSENLRNLPESWSVLQSDDLSHSMHFRGLSLFRKKLTWWWIIMWFCVVNSENTYESRNEFLGKFWICAWIIFRQPQSESVRGWGGWAKDTRSNSLPSDLSFISFSLSLSVLRFFFLSIYMFCLLSVLSLSLSLSVFCNFRGRASVKLPVRRS